MKVLRVKCMMWYSKVLAAALAMLGFVSCTKESADMYGVPVMYGPPPSDSTMVDTAEVMYGVAPARFRGVETTETTEPTETDNL